MASPSPWHASGATLGIATIAGLVLGGWLALTDPAAGVLVGGLTIMVIGGPELQAAYRVNLALREFASQVPGEPTASVSVWGDQTLRWDDPPLKVTGTTSRYRVQKLKVKTGDRSGLVSPIRAREGAREALDTLNRDIAATRLEDRLPTSYPRLTGVKLTATIAIGGPLLYLFGAYALSETVRFPSISPAVPRIGIGAILIGALLGGLLRWATIRRIQRALRNIADELGGQGVHVERIDFVSGLVHPKYRIHTADRPVLVSCPAHPWGQIHTTIGDDKHVAPLLKPKGIGQALATTSLSGTEPIAQQDKNADGSVSVSARKRASFGLCGTAIVAMGLWFLINGPSVQECSSQCGGLALVGLVPFGIEILGAIITLSGFGSLWIALRGSVPRDSARWIRERESR